MMDASEPFSLAQSTGELTAQLALAVDLGDIAAWRCDLGSGCFDFNAQALRMLDMPARPQGHSVDGITALVRPDDRAVAFVGVGQAITARHEAELAQRSVVGRAALVARGAGPGTWERDMASGGVYWDGQMWRLRDRALAHRGNERVRAQGPCAPRRSRCASRGR